MSRPRPPESEGTHWPGCRAQRQNALHQPPRISRPRSCLGSRHAGVCREGAPEWGGLLWALLLVLRTAWLPRCLHQLVPQVLLFCTAHTFAHSPQLSPLVTSAVPSALTPPRPHSHSPTGPQHRHNQRGPSHPSSRRPLLMQSDFQLPTGMPHTDPGVIRADQPTGSCVLRGQARSGPHGPGRPGLHPTLRSRWR